MTKYVCICRWIYNKAKDYPHESIAPGTKWEDVPDDFTCSGYGLGKDCFKLYQS